MRKYKSDTYNSKMYDLDNKHRLAIFLVIGLCTLIGLLGIHFAKIRQQERIACQKGYSHEYSCKISGLK